MNTANIKKYAPQARKAFMGAVMKKINELGIYSETQISDASQQGTWLVVEGRNFDIKIKRLRERLITRVQNTGFLVVVEHIAYTWFNRLCAIRYMELHDYLDHGLRVLSHPDNENSFEILEHTQDVADDLGLNRDQIIELKLAGNQDELLYRTLLLGQCHALHKAMPFLFESIDDETELLLPDNLIRTDSILRGLVNDIPEEDWEQVEIIGWLYQFYISEKKDEVIGNVVKSEDIPAATQLFTPNWIVKYLVQNSVGRQWLQTYPDSSIKAGMEYYIEPAEQTDEVNQQIKAITPDSIEPESIKVLDPACGSGHILVEAYQVLKAIYEERGYRSRDIPQLILENNLFGLDIDDRAAQLAGFALMMLARADDRRIFSRDVQLNVMAMQSTAGFSLQNDECLVIEDEQQRLEFVQIVQDLLVLFEQAKTFGSLIAVPEHITDYLPIAENIVKQLADSGDLFAQNVALTLMPIIKQTEILARKYDAVVANPPYMGSKGMNAELKAFAKKQYPNSKSDLFAICVERYMDLCRDCGKLGLVTPFTWMFIKSYENLRKLILNELILESLIQPEYHAFFDSAYVPLCTFTLTKNHIDQYTGSFIKLSEFYGAELQAPKTLEAIKNRDCGWFFYAKPDDFKKIPGSPIAYWVSDRVRNAFEKEKPLKEIAPTKQGLATGENDRFLRVWSEVSVGESRLTANVEIQDNPKWFPCNKGGAFRKWYGNNVFVVNWKNSGKEIKEFKDENGKLRSRPQNISYYFKEGLTWSALSSSSLSMRYSPETNMFETKGAMCFPISQDYMFSVLAYANSKLVNHFLLATSPTLDYHEGPVGNLPFMYVESSIEVCKELVEIHRDDWNSKEFSWEFKKNPIISINNLLKVSFNKYSELCGSVIGKVVELEEENNRIFIQKYGLNTELSSLTSLDDIRVVLLNVC